MMTSQPPTADQLSAMTSTQLTQAINGATEGSKEWLDACAEGIRRIEVGRFSWHHIPSKYVQTVEAGTRVEGDLPRRKHEH
jgi:hypothetical protein